MPVDLPLLLTKLRPPRAGAVRLPRARLAARLRRACEHRLTLLQAPAGYGKTTLLAGLAGGATPIAWYSVGDEDTDPPRFLAYLLEALRLALPGLSTRPAAVLEDCRRNPHATDWTPVVDVLVNALETALEGPLLLVLDDYDTVARQPGLAALVHRLLQHQPLHLHLLLAARQPVELPGLHAWRARGEVLELGRRELGLDAEEITALFNDGYRRPISAEQAAELQALTEGWPIAVQLFAQGGAPGAARLPAPALPPAALFDFLALEIFAALPAPLRRFLGDIAVLRRLDVAACLAVSADPDAADHLRRLAGQDLFLSEAGDDHYRLHQLFQAFLLSRPEVRAGLTGRHLRAAAHYAGRGDPAEAIHHYLRAEAFDEAAALIERSGEDMLAAGRLETVQRWIEALPTTSRAPRLEVYLADIARLRGRFKDALRRYRSAERRWRAQGDAAGRVRSLRGLALVYLDTVRAPRAQRLLEAALALVDPARDPAEYDRLLMLLAENRLNLGQPDQAESLLRRALRRGHPLPGEDMLRLRLLLRTGRLNEAGVQLAERWEQEHRRVSHSPRSHRETGLMLSLVQSMRGEAAAARRTASSTVQLGEQLGSPLVVGLAYARLGHALQIAPSDPTGDPAGQRAQALAAYQQAAGWFDRLDVRRARAELMLGVARLRGMAGDLEAAREAAREAAEVARWAGDRWLAALVALIEAAALVSAGRLAEALPGLQDTRAAAETCGDRFTEAASLLWLTLVHQRRDDTGALKAAGERLLDLCESHGYDFLLTRASLFGLPDPRLALPALLALRRLGTRPGYLEAVLARLGLAQLRLHPGYQLRVQALGGFQVWRGDEPVAAREWRRGIARELFQLLLSAPGRWFQREELMETLRPESAPDQARSDFKAALNSLNRAIEPLRVSDEGFTYIDRDQSAYRLRPEADLWYDVAAFEQAARAGLAADDRTALERALALYRGDYLPEAPAHHWVLAERERLRELYLRAGGRLGELWLAAGDLSAVLELAHRLLRADPCWEEAHRLLIRALAAQGHRAAALRAFDSCAARLRAELDVAPSPATLALQRDLLPAGDAD